MLFRLEIPKGKIEQIKSAQDLLECLEQLELMSVLDTSLFQVH